MTQNTPLSPCHFRHPVGERQRVLSVEQLKTLGVSPARAAAQCRAGGPWQQPLPGVYVLHLGPPTGEERLRSALLYVGRRRTVPAQGGAAPATGYGEAMVTGRAALALHGFSLVPPTSSLDRIDVLVPRTRRLRSVRYVRVVRTSELPRPEQLAACRWPPWHGHSRMRSPASGTVTPYGCCSPRRSAADTANPARS